MSAGTNDVMQIPEVKTAKAQSRTKPAKISAEATYAAVEALVANGMLKTAAFAEVAEATSRTPSAVTTTYFKYARSLPGGGSVRKSMRTSGDAGAARVSKDSSGGTSRLAQEASRVMATLVARVEELEKQAASDAAELKRLKRIIATL